MFNFRINQVVKTSNRRLSTIKEQFVRDGLNMYKATLGTGLLVISELELQQYNRGSRNGKVQHRR